MIKQCDSVGREMGGGAKPRCQDKAISSGFYNPNSMAVHVHDLLCRNH